MPKRKRQTFKMPEEMQGPVARIGTYNVLETRDRLTGEYIPAARMQCGTWTLLANKNGVEFLPSGPATPTDLQLLIEIRDAVRRMEKE